MFREVELFIARRIGAPSEGAQIARRSTTQRIAAVAIAISLVVMIITLAVIFGFKREVHNKITALSGDVVVASSMGVEPSAESYILATPQVVEIAQQAAYQSDCLVDGVAPYAVISAVVSSGVVVDGVVLKGVDSTYDMALFKSGLLSGEIPLMGEGQSQRNVIISSELATDLGLEVGARLELLVSQSGGESMRRDLYRVGAIYNAGLGSTERGVVVCDIRNVQRLNGWLSEQISGYEVSLNRLDRAREVANTINREVIFASSNDLDGVVAYSAQQLFPWVFDWLAAHDINGVVVVVIMLVVALFNIVTALLIMVMERSGMIGVLKSLGMSSSSVGRVFIYRAVLVSLRGMLWGNVVGLLFCFLQHRFEFIHLDEGGYMLSSVPIEVDVWWWLVLNVAVLTTIMLTVSIPARMVSAIEPHKAIKFQ